MLCDAYKQNILITIILHITKPSLYISTVLVIVTFLILTSARRVPSVANGDDFPTLV